MQPLIKNIYFCVALSIFLSYGIKFSFEISCRNEQKGAIDWYVNYKLPKIENEPSGTKLGDGEAYAYLDTTTTQWKMSKNSISSSASMMGCTLNDLYGNEKGLTYILYNDESPDNYTGSSVGHLKGVIVFDKDSGFWLIHSVPKFPPERTYVYPSSGFINGQSILCVTFKTQELNEIGRQLLFDHPNIYAKSLSNEVASLLDDDVKSLFTSNPAFVRKPPFTRKIIIRSLKNKAFTSFAKDNQFDDDLYSALVAPELKSSLVTETWRRGSGTISPPSCRTDFTVNDVTSINMTILNDNQATYIGFKSTSDHSKWAASCSRSEGWVCIGDINRMESQKKRGGGTLCFKTAKVWQAFRCIVKESDGCNAIDSCSVNQNLSICPNIRIPKLRRKCVKRF